MTACVACWSGLPLLPLVLLLSLLYLLSLVLLLPLLLQLLLLLLPSFDLIDCTSFDLIGSAPVGVYP